MALEEKISRHLGVKFVEIDVKGKKYYLCENGVLFADAEYMNYADLNVEYERREKEDKLYDYAYAKSTGTLRKKRGTSNENVHKEPTQETSPKTDSLSEQKTKSEMVERTPDSDKSGRRMAEHNRSENLRPQSSSSDLAIGRDIQTSERRDGTALSEHEERRESGHTAITFICLLLGFTSVISMYISTLHTATYLYDYVDVFSAWLMSASVTAYNSTAFEVSVLFKQRRRFGLTFVFITLWTMVTAFSMATTVSVFYDRFNFTETQIAEENKVVDSGKLALEMLRTKEKDLREAIDFKKKDIEYRQERDYATTAVRKELEALQTELQSNLTEQQNILSTTPEVTQKVSKKRESLFAFLGRLMHMEGGILEFIMSTLSAIFINLIAPLSLTAVVELIAKNKLTK